MTRRWTNAAGQWIRWLMGESKLPRRGQRAAVIPMILVVILAAAGLTAGSRIMATQSVPAGYGLEADPPTPPPGSLDPITGANTDTSSSSDSVATTTTPAPTPAPAKVPRVPKERVKTARIAGAARVPKVGRLAKGAASTTPTTSPTPVTTTTTTTTTSPDTGGWA